MLLVLASRGHMRGARRVTAESPTGAGGEHAVIAAFVLWSGCQRATGHADTKGGGGDRRRGHHVWVRPPLQSLGSRGLCRMSRYSLRSPASIAPSVHVRCRFLLSSRARDRSPLGFPGRNGVFVSRLLGRWETTALLATCSKASDDPGAVVHRGVLRGSLHQRRQSVGAAGSKSFCVCRCRPIPVGKETGKPSETKPDADSSAVRRGRCNCSATDNRRRGPMFLGKRRRLRGHGTRNNPMALPVVTVPAPRQPCPHQN